MSKQSNMQARRAASKFRERLACRGRGGRSGPATRVYHALDKLGVHAAIERVTGKPCGCRDRAAKIDKSLGY